MVRRFSPFSWSERKKYYYELLAALGKWKNSLVDGRFITWNREASTGIQRLPFCRVIKCAKQKAMKQLQRSANSCRSLGYFFPINRYPVG
jgi:hypothetical protein